MYEFPFITRNFSEKNKTNTSIILILCFKLDVHNGRWSKVRLIFLFYLLSWLVLVHERKTWELIQTLI